MPRKRKKSRLYTRERGGEIRYYADFRDLGGGREALRPEGEKLATTSLSVAEALLGERLKELTKAKESGVLLGVKRRAKLQAFVAEHLIEKAKSGKYSERWLAQAQKHLDTAVAFFGKDRDLLSIGVPEVTEYLAHLRTVSNGRGGTIDAGTQRHYLNSLSNLYKRAMSVSAVPPGFNPVQAMMDKPVGKAEEAAWLEIHDAALLLEAARTYQPTKGRAAEGKKWTPEGTRAPHPHMYPLLATFLLTGGRKAEVLGLEVEDISFDRKTVTFRPNKWRRLKTKTSHRTVPLWPQLEEILREYVFGGDSPRAGLLFPSLRSNGMLVDFDKALDTIAERAGWKKGEVRSKAFRHTYCAARLQTTDHGAPVALYTVQRELGHGGDTLVKRVYGHLGQVRHRSEVVEYRADAHVKVTGYAERLRAIRATS